MSLRFCDFKVIFVARLGGEFLDRHGPVARRSLDVIIRTCVVEVGSFAAHTDDFREIKICVPHHHSNL